MRRIAAQTHLRLTPAAAVSALLLAALPLDRAAADLLGRNPGLITAGITWTFF
jgi:hypothetical protein